MDARHLVQVLREVFVRCIRIWGQQIGIRVVTLTAAGALGEGVTCYFLMVALWLYIVFDMSVMGLLKSIPKLLFIVFIYSAKGAMISINSAKRVTVPPESPKYNKFLPNWSKYSLVLDMLDSLTSLTSLTLLIFHCRRRTPVLSTTVFLTNAQRLSKRRKGWRSLRRRSAT